MKVGIAVTCKECGRTKAPRGRSVLAEIYSSYCTAPFPPRSLHDAIDGCEGYYVEPKPGDLWPGESEGEFGYPCSSNATEFWK